MPAVSTIPLTSSSPGPAGRDGINAFSFTSLDVTAYNGTANLLLTLQNVQWSVVGQAVEVANVGTFKVLSIDSVGLVLTLQPSQVRGTPPFNIPTGTEVSPSGFPGPQGIKGDKGDKGDPGTAGATGTAATVAVGTTTTGAPGTNAAVTNAGNSSAAQFNFTIPRGDVGATGAKGDKGDPGIQGTQGAQGAQGVPGGQGPPGSQGTPGVPGVSTLATTTANGLLKQVSGKTTDFVDGTNNCQDLSLAIQPSLAPMKASPVILGELSTPDSTFPSGIVVPRYATHPDAAWTYGTYDDHFDGTVLNPKWVGNATGNGIIYVGNSQVSIFQPTPTSANYVSGIICPIPTGVDFTLTFKMLFAGAVNVLAGNGAFARFYAGLYAGNVVSSVRITAMTTLFYPTVNAGQQVQRIGADAGANWGTTLQDCIRTGGMPPYWRFSYTQSSKATTLLFSFDGAKFFPWFGTFTGAQTGFSTTPPTTFQIIANSNLLAWTLVSVDWFRITTP